MQMSSPWSMRKPSQATDGRARRARLGTTRATVNAWQSAGMAGSASRPIAAVPAQTVADLPISVHVAVVDPGVGTLRRAIALATDSGLLVGPDNGLLLPAAEVLGGITDAVELTKPDWHRETVSATFHGRDIF